MSSAEGKLDNERKSSVGQHVLQAETQDVYDEPAPDPVYQAKARILNDALQDIGMGKYQASPCFHSFLLHAPRLPSPWCVRWIDTESASGFCSSSLALVGYRERFNLSSNWVADISGQPVITFGRWVQLGTVATVTADSRRLML